MSKRPSQRQLSQMREHEQNMLDKKVRTDGVGEDPIVQAVLSEEFAKASPQQSFEIGVALQQMLTGMGSMMQSMAAMQDSIARTNERLAKYEADRQAWEENQEKFLAEVRDRAESLRDPDSVRRADTQARVEAQYADQVKIARAKQTTERLAYEQQLATEPKETIVAAGNVEMVRQGDSTTAQIFPEVLRIKHKTWVFPPGVPTQVPHSIAEEYRRTLLRRQEAEDRASVLRLGAAGLNGAQYQDTQIAKRIRDVDIKWGSPTESMPIASNT